MDAVDGNDRYRLARFVEAQEGVLQVALTELRNGHKRSHWMWFVFPQIAGLGRSPMAREYAISGLAEARAYLAHPELGPRLRTATQILLDRPRTSAEEIFGGIDAMKLRSSMTLFQAAAPDERVFGEVLERYFGGEADAATERLL
jgi:uncharacterized protein (DUF1810 family)